MRRATLWFFYLSLATTAVANQPTERPTLVLDTGGHTAMVRKVLFTPDGKQLISVSDDKTIRVWDVATGAALRVLRPPIGSGAEGRLFASALSPDGHILAVAEVTLDYGVRPLNSILLNPYCVYLFDLHSGLIVKRFREIEGPISSLAFSPDGTQLLTSSTGVISIRVDVENDNIDNTLYSKVVAQTTYSETAFALHDSVVSLSRDGEVKTSPFNTPPLALS